MTFHPKAKGKISYKFVGKYTFSDLNNVNVVYYGNFMRFINGQTQIMSSV